VGTRDELAEQFGISVEDVDQWLAQAAEDVKRLGWLPYEEELRKKYGWANDKQDAFINALMAAARV
jgi:hypothetical protein